MLGFKLLSTTAAFVFTLCDVNYQCQAMSELCVETLWYGGQTDAIARQLNLCYIFYYKKSAKLYIHYKIALNTPLQGKEFFCFHA